jgi:hypothetical protein
MTCSMRLLKWSMSELGMPHDCHVDNSPSTQGLNGYALNARILTCEVLRVEQGPKTFSETWTTRPIMRCLLVLDLPARREVLEIVICASRSSEPIRDWTTSLVDDLACLETWKGGKVTGLDVEMNIIADDEAVPPIALPCARKIDSIGGDRPKCQFICQDQTVMRRNSQPRFPRTMFNLPSWNVNAHMAQPISSRQGVKYGAAHKILQGEKDVRCFVCGQKVEAEEVVSPTDPWQVPLHADASGHECIGHQFPGIEQAGLLPPKNHPSADEPCPWLIFLDEEEDYLSKQLELQAPE